MARSITYNLLGRLASLQKDECNEFILRLCKVCTPKPSTAKELLQRYRNQFIPSDVGDLDKCLRGGFRVGSVTEVVGRAGVGKTQLVMQLCVVAARLGFGSIFIDTERKLSLQRLNEIARERARRSDPNIAGAGNVGMGFDYDAFKCDEEQRNESGLKYRHPNVVMKNVTVHSPASTDDLLSVVSKLDEEILLRNEAAAEIDSEYPVKLIILDSIAAPTRRDFGGDTAPKRVAAIFQIAQWLKRVADQMQVAVVVINQIDKVQGSASDQSYDTDFVSVTAALGTSWHHCVSTRVALEHEKDPHRDDVLRSESLNRGRVRTATVVKSNLVEKSTISFEVSVTGIRQVYE